MAGAVNYGYEALATEEDAEILLSGRDLSGTTSHSELLRTAVNAITANQENVFTGVLDVVQDHHRQKLKLTTLLCYALYVLAFAGLVAGIGCLMFVSIQAGIVFIALIGLSVLAILIFIFMLVYVCFGKSHRVINWRLMHAARYINVCQVSDEYTKSMLPNFSPDVQEVCHCQLAGSSGDSFGFFPSFSANVSQYSRKPTPFTQDVDMNLFYDALVLREQNLMDIGRPGFCWVQINQDELLTGAGESFISDCLIQHPQKPGRSYLSGKLVSEKIGSFIPTERRNVSYNYPAITYKTEIKGPQGRFNFDVDVVFGIKLSLWPEVADTWPERVKDKLPGDVVQSIQSLGCYIVHKHCGGSDFQLNHQNHGLDWRITFAEAESLLFKYHASKEALKICYIILKFTLKNYSNTSKRSLPALKSYHLKTVFLWLAEEGHTTYDLVEAKNNVNLANLFLLLIEKYEDVLEKGQLPHYFMPSVNIIASYSKEELSAGIKVLKGLRRRPILTIEAFDHAWINQKRYAIMMLSFFFFIVIAIAVRAAFPTSDFSDSDESFLDLVGEKNKDLLKYNSDTRLKFLRCLKEKYHEVAALFHTADPEPAILYCREKLGLK